MVVAPTVAARHMRRRRGSMSNYVTAIGLDVHARSISACAFDPMTGEWIGNTYLDDSGRDSPASLNSTGDM